MAEIVNLIMQHVTQAGFFLRGSNGLGGLFALSILGGSMVVPAIPAGCIARSTASVPERQPVFLMVCHPWLPIFRCCIAGSRLQPVSIGKFLAFCFGQEQHDDYPDQKECTQPRDRNSQIHVW